MGVVIEDFSELGITRVSRWIFNCYVIDGPEGAVVVDAGLPGISGDLAGVLRRRGGSIRAIVATHGHSDHVGGAPELARKFNAPVFVPANTLTYFDGPRPVAPTLAKAARIWPTFMDQPFDAIGAFRAAKGVKVAGYAMGTDMAWTGPPPQGGLAEGQAVPGAPGWTVIESPGHSDDSIALWNPATGTLLSGDAVVTADGRAWHTPETIDERKAETTRRRLEELPVRQLLPGHGRPVRATGTVWETQRR